MRKARFEQQATLEADFNAYPMLPAAQALGHQAVRQSADVRFTKTSRILAELAVLEQDVPGEVQ
ncbi:ATP-binding protein [Streptomyces sp. NRRL S-646]|uniref:ATP-binding protein n=1 Tax=Streptomyces sp. NRRL S-646 TaxID=1463917 RepID=UPI001F3A8B20|nr:ATP-binding protein [Streptomyces sp. NRRL S-646]